MDYESLFSVDKTSLLYTSLLYLTSLFHTLMIRHRRIIDVNAIKARARIFKFHLESLEIYRIPRESNEPCNLFLLAITTNCNFRREEIVIIETCRRYNSAEPQTDYKDFIILKLHHIVTSKC